MRRVVLFASVVGALAAMLWVRAPTPVDANLPELSDVTTAP